MSFAPIVNAECATASFAATLGKDNAAALRSSCGRTDAAIFLLLCISAVAILVAVNGPNWSRLLPVFLGLGYALLYVPLRTAYDNASDMAFKASGLTKSEWLGAIAADQRTRLTVMASLTAAIIVSANAWISRWEASKVKSATVEA